MKIIFATDHAGFELKEALLPYVRDELGYDVEDVGAYTLDPEDDYPSYMSTAAKRVSADPDNINAIILGGSGQTEAVVANRFKNVRAVVYYGSTGTQVDADGNTLDMIASTREHTNANVLSLGARFISVEDAKETVAKWLSTDFSGEARHVRRLASIDELTVS